MLALEAQFRQRWPTELPPNALIAGGALALACVGCVGYRCLSASSPPVAPPAAPALQPKPKVSFATDAAADADTKVELDLSSTDEEDEEIMLGGGSGSSPSSSSSSANRNAQRATPVRRPTKLELMSLGGPATYSPLRFADALEAGPASGTKFMTLLRHGQASHNVNAEAMRAKGCTFEQFIAQMKKDDVFDAPLTQIGQRQAATAATSFARTLCAQKIELVVSSPLTRAIATADAVLPASVAQTRRRVVREEFRERCGMLLCGKRRTVSALAAAHPGWDLSQIAEEDQLWTETIEKTDVTCGRAYAGLLWLWEQPERHVCVVGHGGIFDSLLKHHPHIIADVDMSASFANCEVRTCRLTLAPHCDTPHPDGQASTKLTFKLDWVRN